MENTARYKVEASIIQANCCKTSAQVSFAIHTKAAIEMGLQQKLSTKRPTNNKNE